MFECADRDSSKVAMSGEEVIALYESVSDLSRQMLMAARSSDWDGLCRLEQDCATRLNILKSGCPPLVGEMRLRKVRLLQGILADDRETRIITEPWAAHLPYLMNLGRDTKQASTQSEHAA